MSGAEDEIERLVGRWDAAGGASREREDLYVELRGIAESLMRKERRGHTLQPTALVHEAFLRLAGSENLEGADRLRFLDAAAVTMRRVLVDHARKVGAERRGGQWNRVTLQGAVLDGGEVEELDLEALQRALEAFEEVDPRAAKIVELRFFAGLTGDEMARHLGISRNTVVRELTHARAWLGRRLDPGGGEAG